MPSKKEKPVADLTFGFGGIFKSIGDLMELANKMQQEGKEEFRKTGEFGLGKSKAMYGINIRVGPEGKPKLETFGNIGEKLGKPTIKKEREPLTDVFQEKGNVRVVAELPGVDEKDIATSVKGNMLTISTAKSAKSQYYKEIELPKPVKKTLKVSYKNGILEIILK